MIIALTRANLEYQRQSVREDVLKSQLTAQFAVHSLMHAKCLLILISNLNLIGLFSTERGKRDLEN